MQLMAKAKDPDDGSRVREDRMEELMRVNLNKFIEEIGLHAHQVADLSGVSQSALGRQIRGENKVSGKILPALAALFGRSPSDFYAEDPPPRDPNRAFPIVLKHIPGATWSEEDQKDQDEFLEKLKARRAAKTPAPSPKRKAGR